MLHVSTSMALPTPSTPQWCPLSIFKAHPGSGPFRGLYPQGTCELYVPSVTLTLSLGTFWVNVHFPSALPSARPPWSPQVPIIAICTFQPNCPIHLPCPPVDPEFQTDGEVSPLPTRVYLCLLCILRAWNKPPTPNE